MDPPDFVEKEFSTISELIDFFSIFRRTQGFRERFFVSQRWDRQVFGLFDRVSARIQAFRRGLARFRAGLRWSPGTRRPVNHSCRQQIRCQL